MYYELLADVQGVTANRIAKGKYHIIPVNKASTILLHTFCKLHVLRNIRIFDVSVFVHSLCTTLSVEWEPDLIAISLLYLSCRLMKFKVESWVDKPVGYTGKWYNFFVSDVNLDIIESELYTLFYLT